MGKVAVSDPALLKTHDPRFERKFIYENMLPEDLIENVILTNSFGFREIYSHRQVNNIYFDDRNYSFYKTNVDGTSQRLKYRLRWYGDDFANIVDPAIEIKKKFGEVGDKYVHKLKGLTVNLDDLSNSSISDLLSENLKQDALISNFKHLIPTLFNSYQRRYFLSFCGSFRITADYQMEFYKPLGATWRYSRRKLNDVVMELKYSLPNDNESRELTQDFEARLTKNSKYVRGFELVNS